MSLDETLRKLAEVEAAMLVEQERMEGMDFVVQQKLKALVLEHYPNFGEWDADLIRQVDDAIWRAADDFVRKVEKACHTAETRQGLPE